MDALSAADPDAADVARAIDGDSAAFGRLYLRHASRIATLARRMVGPDSANDATQEVFVHAWERLDQFRGEARFGSWLYRVATTVLLRYADVARRIAARSADQEVDELMAPTYSAEATMDLNHALSRLAPALRAVVVLHDMEGFRHDEIAGLLAISTSASKMRLHRGRMMLREWLLP